MLRIYQRDHSVIFVLLARRGRHLFKDFPVVTFFLCPPTLLIDTAIHQHQLTQKLKKFDFLPFEIQQIY